MLREFREFIAKGNVLDLAVAVIIGAAFAKIVTSLTDDIIMPIIGKIFGGLDFSSHFRCSARCRRLSRLDDRLCGAQESGRAGARLGRVRDRSRQLRHPRLHGLYMKFTAAFPVISASVTVRFLTLNQPAFPPWAGGKRLAGIRIKPRRQLFKNRRSFGIHNFASDAAAKSGAAMTVASDDGGCFNGYCGQGFCLCSAGSTAGQEQNLPIASKSFSFAYQP